MTDFPGDHLDNNLLVNLVSTGVVFRSDERPITIVETAH